MSEGKSSCASQCHFWTFCPFLIVALIYYLFGATAEKRKSIAGANQNNNEVVDTSACCASCGIAQDDDDIKLMPCNGCDLVKYCSDECKEDHKKRTAELRRDELLFKQPESTHHGDCPICSLPLPIDSSKSGMTACCSKTICIGCFIANTKRETELRLQPSCPFCREPTPKTKEEYSQQNMKRVEANDPSAMRHQGREQYQQGNYTRAFEYWTKAAELGDSEAHYRLGDMYDLGKGVEKDIEKEIYHMEEAAIGGHPIARHNLAYHEYRHGNVERAVKHWVIAAKQGQDDSMKSLMIEFREGNVEKEVLAGALRVHKAAVDAMKSSQRGEAEEFYRNIGMS